MKAKKESGFGYREYKGFTISKDGFCGGWTGVLKQTGSFPSVDNYKYGERLSGKTLKDIKLKIDSFIELKKK